MEESNYNIFRKTSQGNYVVMNTLTGALLKFENIQQLEDAKKIINNPNIILNSDSEIEKIKDNLIKGHFLIGSKNQEEERLRTSEFLAQYASKGIALTILSTFECNFKCVYCYEEQRKIRLDAESAGRIIKYIENQTKYKSNSPLKIAWYGGEPLMDFEIIRELTSKIQDICKKNNCKLIPVMITNGYLLDEYIINIIINEFNLYRIMITIDGPEEIHDKRRPLINGGRTYKTILTNISKFIEKNKKTTVKIRINLDNENIEYLETFLNELPKKIIDNVIFEFEHTSMLSTVSKAHYDKMFIPKDHSQKTKKVLHAYNKYINKNRNIQQIPYVFRPNRRWGTYCGVECLNSFVIGPQAEIYKCAAMVGEKDSIGKINIDGKLYIDEEKLANWVIWNIKSSTPCGVCRFRPLCHGGCKSKKISKYPACTQLNWSYKTFLDWFVDKCFY